MNIITIALFEDDVELAELLRDGMELKKYSVVNHYDLKDESWSKVDIVLADYRNTLVRFDDLKILCQSHEIPIIAISGSETGQDPQLLKPFSINDLEESILRNIIFYNLSKKESEERFSLLKLFKKSV